jgi:hypothetical protein
VSVAQYAVTAGGLAAIVWVLWYFLFSRGPAAVEPSLPTADRKPSASPHQFHG